MGVDASPANQPTSVGAARRAILAIFAICGFITATWVAYIPVIKDHFGLGDGALGITLLAVATGSVVALLPSGALIARFGSRPVTTLTTLVCCVALPLVILAPSYELLVALLFALGCCFGGMDVAMNAQAVAVENRHGRPLMSTFHGTYSGAALLGAACASLILSAGIAPDVHVIAVAVVLGAIGVLASRALLPAEIDRATGEPTFARLTGPLASLGILALLALLAEGVMSDWGAVYLHESLRTTSGFAAIGFAAFSLTMALGRFAGDPLRARVPSVRFLQLSGTVAAAGLATALLLNDPMATLAGFAVVGLGLSNVVPVVVSLAGQTPGIATGTAVAAVTTAGYIGFLIGPPAIGFVSQATSLPLGLGIVVVTLGLIVALAAKVRPSSARLGS
jgi:fucose permease